MIGLSTVMFPRDKWMQDFNRTGIKCVEIDFKASFFPEKIKHARADVKPWSTYFNTSAYSGAGKLFSDDKNLRKSQEQKVLGEIKVCKAIKSRELIIQLDNEEFHKRTTTKFAKALNRKAVFEGVQLLIENNSQGRFSNIIDIDYILQQTKTAQSCLNTYNLERSGNDILEFIKSLNTKIKYVRVNNQTSNNIIKIIMRECNPLKWIIADTTMTDAMQTLQKITSQGVEV